MKTIEQILIEKLTKEEFSALTDKWEDGSFDEWTRNAGNEIDAKNFPEKYIWPSNEDDVGDEAGFDTPENFS